MEIKDIIKEDRSKIVPSYEYRDYYREDGSRLYNSNREANWYKIGILDCFDYFEQNRLKACESQTEAESERELNFAIKFFEEHHRQPTFSDAIEATRKQIIDKICKWLEEHLYDDEYLVDADGCLINIDSLINGLKKAMEEQI